MPIQAPQWTDYLNCPVCCREFGAPPRSPVSLGCGHTLCRHCLNQLHKKQCPFDQAEIHVEPEELVVNTALLQLAGFPPPASPYHPPCIQALPEADRTAYDVIVHCCEHLALFLKICGNGPNNNAVGSRLSRPMQRKLVTLLQCAMTDEEGRGRAARAARSLGERTVTELILQHQNPQQLSANLWAAVRARGCQFLGPAMQEEVLKLVLLALEDGSALSRKVLVMFVVQRLEPHFPQASKTSIGHVVQLLYRASCFKVSKRECDSSLMQLKDDFRTYESLRREHDAQIVQIATEAGLRVAPDQWSALLYGDNAHKSHMQSIIDKLQTPQSFAQSIQELFIALQRTGDPAQLVVMSLHLDKLAGIDASPDAKSPTWQELAEITTSLKEVVSGLVQYLQQQAAGRDANHNQKNVAQERTEQTNNNQASPQTVTSTPTHAKYKVMMCRDAANRSFCPRGNACTFAHSEEELERYRNAPNHGLPNEDGTYVSAMHTNMSSPLQHMPAMLPPHIYPGYPPPPPPPHHTVENNYIAHMQPPPMPHPMPADMPPHPVEYENGPHVRYPMMPNQPMPMERNGILMPPVWQHGYIYPEDAPNCLPYHPGAYPRRVWGPPRPLRIMYQEPPPSNAYGNHSPYQADEAAVDPSYPYAPRDRPHEQQWHSNGNHNVYFLEGVRNALPYRHQTYEGDPQSHNHHEGPTMPAHMFSVPGDRPAVGPDRLAEFVDRIAAAGVFDSRNGTDGYQNPQRLVEKLEALERGLIPENE